MIPRLPGFPRRMRGRARGGRPAGPARSLALALLLAAGAGPAQATPMLSEVLYDAEGSDAGGVFVELAGAPGESLEGLALEGVNGSDGSVTTTVALEGALADDGLFVVADPPDAAPGPFARVDLFAEFDLQNGPDSVRLVDAGGSVLDALGYGDFGAGDVFAGEGAPAPDAPAGASLARRLADVDTDVNADDFVVLETPTPGAAPRTVPEPAGLLLGLAGLVFATARAAPLRRAAPRSAPAHSSARASGA